MRDYYAPAPRQDASVATKAPSLFQPSSVNSVSSEPSPLQAAMLSGRVGPSVVGHKLSSVPPTQAIARNPSEPSTPKDTHVRMQGYQPPRYSQQSSHSARSIPQGANQEEEKYSSSVHDEADDVVMEDAIANSLREYQMEQQRQRQRDDEEFELLRQRS